MKKDVRKISKKNYVLVGLILVVTVIFLGYFTFWYKSNQEYYRNNSVMSGYLSEIQENGVIDNLTNYVLDNPNTLLYVSYGNDSSVKRFEDEFKRLIVTKNISSNFIYIDLNYVTDKNFVLNIKNSFFSEELKNKNLKLEKQSNIFVFENGKIIDVLYGNRQNISLTDVTRFLIRHEVIEND
ncbi:MAG: hypothetical protein E7165_04665 [Firmicutes bacterium]|nr:hypothetical protein [Bacillota bacterium]